MNNILSKSAEYKEEYCASVVKVGKLEPIDGADNILKANINGYNVVVSKDIHEGDIMIYIKNETKINEKFLNVNNLFEISHPELNSNFEEVKNLISSVGEEEANKIIRDKHMAGYFSKNCRLRMVKLRGCASYGMLVDINSLCKWNSKLNSVDFSQYIKYDDNGNIIPFNFDTVDGKLLCEAYIPKIKNTPGSGKSKKEKKLAKFDRIIPGEFVFHYDTNMLRENITRFKPDTSVAITLKMHGTSVIVAYVKTKTPVNFNYLLGVIKEHKGNGIKTFFKGLGEAFKLMRKGYYIDYSNVTSSRTVIKNRDINPNVTPGYYDVDIWSKYGNILHKYLDKGMTVYGEICGYLNDEKLIQQGYDYGCDKGKSFLMPYRITMNKEDGTRDEMDIEDVYKWTIKLLEHHPELIGVVVPIQILYNGKLGDLYPNLDVNQHWHENLINNIHIDKRFSIELNEKYCKNKVPREGIVVRVNGKPEIGAFKFKGDRFYEREAKSIDKEEVDIEMNEEAAN